MEHTECLLHQIEHQDLSTAAGRVATVRMIPQLLGKKHGSMFLRLNTVLAAKGTDIFSLMADGASATQLVKNGFFETMISAGGTYTGLQTCSGPGAPWRAPASCL